MHRNTRSTCLGGIDARRSVVSAGAAHLFGRVAYSKRSRLGLYFEDLRVERMGFFTVYACTRVVSARAHSLLGRPLAWLALSECVHFFLLNAVTQIRTGGTSAQGAGRHSTLCARQGAGARADIDGSSGIDGGCGIRR